MTLTEAYTARRRALAALQALAFRDRAGQDVETAMQAARKTYATACKNYENIMAKDGY